ncbi:MAG: hypothetical protein ACOX7P_05630 [Oscillospiraceae bacterium]|jgi:hypothetical protein
MDNFIKLCEERHKAVDGKILEHSKRLDEQGRKIDVLERSDAANTTQIENLTRAITNQTKAIWGLVLAVASTLAGFFIWYVQSLG